MKKGLIVILFFSSQLLYSQNISVLTFQLISQDINSTVFKSVVDQNGEYCAIIKIVTKENDFSWDADALGIVSVEKKEDCYLLYVPHGAKRLSIAHSKFGILRDYFYPISIVENKIYELVLKTEDLSSEMQHNKGKIEIESIPSQANVYLNNVLSGRTPFSKDTIIGNYKLRIEHPLFIPDTGTINLSKSYPNFKLSINLKESFGSIYVTSYPSSNADVLINGKFTGLKTPCTIYDVKYGTQSISIKRGNYSSDEIPIVIFDKGPTNISVGLTNIYPIKSNAILKSIVFPGWGTSYLSGKKFHLLKGLLFYSIIVYNNNCLSKIKTAQNSMNSKMEDEYIKKYEYSTIAYISIWSIDFINVLIKKPNLRKNNIRVIPVIDPVKRNSSVALQLGF